jgi:predicted RecB family nuclease
MDNTKLEYYIDFETITHLNKNYVYMIGLGHVYDGSWNYSCFTLECLDEVSEREMYTKVMNHIEETNKKYKVSYKPLFYHWSSVEPYKMNKMVNELKLPQNTIKWYDLYKFFRDNLITVKGAYSHSLKSIGKGMFENKLIGTFWEGDILMDNKIHMIAYNYYNKNNRAEFNKLIDYNEVDCKIMYDILKVIRGLKK